MNKVVLNNSPFIDIPMSLAQDIVGKIQAVGETMQAENNRQKYITHNHDNNKFWDMLNTDISEILNSPNCMAITKKRGFWELILAFYKPSGLIITFMREKRFETLKSEIRKRGRMTYVDMLVRHLNSSLIAPTGQISLLPKTFSDEEKLTDRMQKLLYEFMYEDATINNYVMVLLDSDSSYELRSVRVVLVDPNLDIVSEIDWSQFILVKEPTVVEKVINPLSPSNNPSRGLTLKPKALERKHKQEGITSKEIKNKQSDLQGESPPNNIKGEDDTTE